MTIRLITNELCKLSQEVLYCKGRFLDYSSVKRGWIELIIYNEPSSHVLEHILDNEIGYVLQNNVKHLMNKSISVSELRSWGNSLPQMARVLRDANVKDDTHILLEYKLPSTEKRIEFLITGHDKMSISYHEKQHL